MFKNRSYCGELSIADENRDVLLAGWLLRKRDLGGIKFIQLRDVSGVIQLVVDPALSSENAAISDRLKSEFVLKVTGKIRKRSKEAINPDMPTGDIEVVVNFIEILNTSQLPPIMIESREEIGEDLRLKYRFLDLRREEMRDSIIKRHIAMQTARRYLCENRFFEIETPILNKSTPEGARDFLVPSRIRRGEFYALPQSPQLFKQILMISGFDRYFQIVKCFRDEDLRNDRQPEFTQIDMEISFVDPDIVMELVEGMLKEIVKDVTGKETELPFKKITYNEAIERYGTDSPDTRFGLEIVDCSDIFIDSGFNVFNNALSSGGVIKGISVPDNGRISRKMIDGYTEDVKAYGAKGFPMFKYANGKIEGGISKFISEDEVSKLIKRFDISDPRIIFFSVDNEDIVNDTLSNMRLRIADDLDMIDRTMLDFIWITDFPLFEYNSEDKRFYSKHHPFTAPNLEFIEDIDDIKPESVEKVTARAYDIVLNGVEIGGGSIRINTPEMQERIFALLGISKKEVEEKFSFLTEALKYGAPPHGGIALGLDRIIMILLNKKSIRDVIAFPKTYKGQCLMSNAPSAVSEEQLKELSLKVVER